jgi:hypothetical protein
MADRTVMVGDTFPEVLLQISDETGVLNLSPAQVIDIQFIGMNYEFSITGTPIWPAQADPGTSNEWNLSGPLTAGDTANADVYQIFVTVTWTSGSVQTFATGDTFTVEAFPVA